MPQDTKAVTQIPDTAEPDSASSALPAASTRRVSSAELFAGGREIEIDHNGRRYQLRITQTGKLILTA